MVKQKIYLLDTGKSQVGDASVITGYTQLNSGSEMLLFANNVSMQIGKATTVDTSIARKDSGFYKEGTVQANSVGNRTFTIGGVLDIKVAAQKVIYANLIKSVRSPAYFALRCELTDYDDDPNGTNGDAVLDTNFIADSYVFVIVTNFTPVCSSDDQNIIDYALECVFIND